MADELIGGIINLAGATPDPQGRARVKRYRANHRRIDYVPSPDALAIIEKHLRTNSNNYSLAGMLDYLVQAGDHVISGNGHVTNRT